MKIEIADLSGLPEGLKSVVETEGETNTIDLSKLSLTSEVEKFKGQKLQAEAEAIERRQALKQWKALGETPEAVQARIDAAGKGQNEDHEKIVSELKANHAVELEARDKKYNTLLGRTTSADLKAELAKAGVVSEGLDLLANFAAARIKHDEEGNPQVMAEDGKTPMVGSAANGGATLADLAADLAKGIPHLVKDGGKGGGGKQPGTGGTPTLNRSKMSAEDKAEYINEHGQDAYLKLPK